MKSLSFTAVVMVTALAGAAFAQSPPATNMPAPPPTVTAPAVVPGAPVAALTDRDANFISAQLENNMAEVAAAQLALERSQNPNVRGLAEKMITDHNYAQNTLQPIASMHRIAPPSTPSDPHQAMLDRLTQLDGAAFDREYVNDVVNDHAQEVFEFNTELPLVVDAHVSAWTQNIRPMLLQHQEIAQQLLTSLPRSG
jgi:putative membrane protein